MSSSSHIFLKTNIIKYKRMTNVVEKYLPLNIASNLLVKRYA